MSWRELVLRNLFKILHAESVFGALHHSGTLFGRDLLRPGDRRASGEKLQEVPAAM